MEIIMDIAFAAVLLYISVCDIRERKIPDRGCLMIVFLAVLQALNGSVLSFTDRLLGVAAVSLPLLFLAVLCRGCFGGGDIKLMAAGGLLLGSAGIFSAFVAGITFAGVYCGVRLVMRKFSRKDAIPLGPFLSIGMALCVIVCYIK